MSWSTLSLATGTSRTCSGWSVQSWRNLQATIEGHPERSTAHVAYEKDRGDLAWRSAASRHWGPLDKMQRETQGLSVSYDDKSFVYYDQNPILASEKSAFRDPQVFYDATTARWIMIIALSDDRKVSFYSAPAPLRSPRSGDPLPPGSRRPGRPSTRLRPSRLRFASRTARAASAAPSAATRPPPARSR